MKRAWFSGCAVIALMTAGVVHAQAAAADGAPVATAPDSSAVEEVVVVAQKRSENLQKVPVSVTAISAAALQARGATNVLQLSNLAPGLQVSTGDSSANPKIFIRGVGLSDFSPNSSSSVGIYVDDVYVGSPLAQLAGFYDLQQVEVLRGPQGTLYGRNTNGGAINVTTKRPTMDYSGDASVEYGRFNYVNAQAGVGGPIIPGKLAFRVAGMVLRDDGYTYNRTLDDHVNYADRYAGRFSLLYTPRDDLTVLAQVNRFVNRGSSTNPQHRGLLCAEGQTYSDGCADALGYADTDHDNRALDANFDGKDKVDVFGSNLEINKRFDHISLVSITSWQWAHRADHENTDASPEQMIEAHYRSQDQQFTQELRLQSDSSQRLRWVLGAYYLHDNLHDESDYDILRDLRPYFVSPDNPLGVSLENSIGDFTWPYQQKTDGYAVFGQADYKITDKLSATIGLRWSSDHKSFNEVSKEIDSGYVLLTDKDSKTFSDWSGRASLQYAFTDNVNGYISYNRGYKAGGFFGNQATTLAQLEPYGDEKLDAYEAGIKTELFDRKLRFNASAFYYAYKNQQVFAQVLRNGVTTSVLDNAGKSRSYGGEAEVTARPIQGLNIYAGVSLLDTKFTKYVTVAGDDLTGNRLAMAPTFTGNASISYEIPLGTAGSVVPEVDFSYRTKVYFDNSNSSLVGDGNASKLDAQIAWRLPDTHTEVGVWGRNLMNKTDLLSVSNIDSLGVDLVDLGPPRTYGVFLRYHF